MGKHKTKTCYVCIKSMRGDVLKRHMKKHDVKTKDNVVNKELHDGKTENNLANNEEQKSCTDEELENEVININKEFNRKIELGRKLNKIVNKHEFNENIFDCENDKRV